MKCRACIDVGTLGTAGECTDPRHQAAGARCERSDLPVTMCAHCRGHDEPAPEEVHVYHTIRAQRPGRCALNDEHRIAEDDWIGRTEHGWACTKCARLESAS